MGELVRAFFEGDFLTDFDSVYLLDGNSVRQYRATVEKRLTDTLAGSVSVRYGSIDGEVSPRVERLLRHHVEHRATSTPPAPRSRSCPTRTGFAVLVRSLRQNLQTPASSLANDADKLALSVAQDLSIIGLTPFGADWKLLVAFEQAQGHGGRRAARTRRRPRTGCSAASPSRSDRRPRRLRRALTPFGSAASPPRTEC